MTQTAPAPARRFRVGFDVGGTFTDFTLLAEHTGALHYFKVPSTPHDPAEAIQAGLSHLMREHGIAGPELAHVGHGTTVATNMVIERRGSRCALVTTRGFRDVLEIGRQTRPHLYDYNVTKPAPLAPRAWRFEISERIAADGSVLAPLDEDEVVAVARQLAAAQVESVAICFMHSYRNDAHERRARDILAEYLPGAYLSVSSEILPEFREYERMSTTALNAYVGPRMAAYMRNLVDSVRGMGVSAPPATVHSNGGLMSVESVLTAPVRTCVSGPAAGVIGAAELGRAAGFPNLITFDVGGTSTDVSLVADLQPLFTSSRLVADYPVKTQMVDVHVIGAGGGSIARIDDAGALKVGPQSAGAVPGPIAYNRGGTVATLTDAHVVLGRLNPVALLEGRMAVHAEQARAALQAQIAGPLGLSVEEAAYGILRIANSNMARAVRAVSTERGHDVRKFALCAFGGAGGLHAAELARDCGIGKVLIPQEPGTMCARGILLSDISMDFVQTLMAHAHADGWLAVQQSLDTLADKAGAWLAEEGVPGAAQRLSAVIDARYQGQNFEIPVPLDGMRLMPLADFIAAFSAAHIREYGYDAAERAIEIVNCRVRAVGLVPRAPLARVAGGRTLDEALKERRRVYFEAAGWLDTPVYRRALLPPDTPVEGPAVIEEMSSTTVVLPGQQARADEYGNLIVNLHP
ncbi:MULTISPECIES: hydantoinase/oxoprolinase family protein [Bordetella]|uniref:5-oxoprolinase n=2 Tax=Bordetella TaxID=517 RepID=A0A261VQI9_9BORD|nr:MULTISPECIES: hydantoinase/oxoprolinase family protein [Bordetella]MDM9557600.1 hydantoinase/oxoprolinase family protein [Bordetella petrii]OZI75850.1 5-oxoprolinase [Bordetella genomosp. 2]